MFQKSRMSDSYIADFTSREFKRSLDFGESLAFRSFLRDSSVEILQCLYGYSSISKVTIEPIKNGASAPIRMPSVQRKCARAVLLPSRISARMPSITT